MAKRVIKAVGKNNSTKVELNLSIQTTSLDKRESNRKYEWMRNRLYSMLSVDFDNSQIKIK